MVNQRILLYEISKVSQYYKKMLPEIIDQHISTMEYGYLCYLDKNVPDSTIDKWHNMNEHEISIEFQKFTNEMASFHKTQFRPKLENTIKEKKAKKKKTQLIGTLLQIFGLLLNQIGIIIQVLKPD